MVPGSGALGRGPARQVRVMPGSGAPRREPARQVRVVPDTELNSMEC